MVQSQSERVWGMSSFAFGAIVIAAGVVGYFLTYLFGRQRSGNERSVMANLHQ